MSGRSAQLVLPISANPGATWSHWVSRAVTGEVESLLVHCLIREPVSSCGRPRARERLLTSVLHAQPVHVICPWNLLTITEAIEHAENDTMVVVDDIHLIDGHRSWQEALFHCYNHVQNRYTLPSSATQSPLA